MSDNSDIESQSEKDPKESKSVVIRVRRDTFGKCKSLARYFGTSQKAVTEAALMLLRDRTSGTDIIQIPELMSMVADLEETVGRLIIQGDHLERLAHELAAFEALRHTPD